MSFQTVFDIVQEVGRGSILNAFSFLDDILEGICQGFPPKNVKP